MTASLSPLAVLAIPFSNRQWPWLIWTLSPPVFLRGEEIAICSHPGDFRPPTSSGDTARRAHPAENGEQAGNRDHRLKQRVG